MRKSNETRRKKTLQSKKESLKFIQNPTKPSNFFRKTHETLQNEGKSQGKLKKISRKKPLKIQEKNNRTQSFPIEANERP